MRRQKHHLYKRNPNPNVLVALPLKMRRLSVVSLCGSTRMLQRSPRSIDELVRAYHAGAISRRGSGDCASCFAILHAYAGGARKQARDARPLLRRSPVRAVRLSTRAAAAKPPAARSLVPRDSFSHDRGAGGAPDRRTGQLLHADGLSDAQDLTTSRRDDETEVPCPCGRGKRVTRYDSNDWGRFEVHERMECQHCEKLYVVVRRFPDWRRRRTPGSFLVLREEHERNEAAARAYQTAERARLDAVKRGHGTALLAALEGFKTRRALFEEVQRRRLFWGSFNYFNELMKKQGREHVILGLVTCETLEPIAHLLGLPEETLGL